jgi:tetratricopeptide (TPR) repeat protein
MGLFDKFRRKSPPNLDTPEQLLDALTDAIARQDGARFEALCQAHTDAIVAAFPVWQKPGPGRDPADLQSLIQVLGQTAQYLDQVLGRPEPWRRLTGQDQGDNPFDRWQATQQQIMRRVEVFDYAGAIELARELLASLDGFSGPGRDQQEELTRGLLGQLLAQAGRPDEAVEMLEWTLAACEARGDDEGIEIYLRALHEADRDRGRPSTWRARLADHVERRGDAGEAAWLRDVDRRYPEGEPLLRMVALVGERKIELDALDRATLDAAGGMQVLFERNRRTLAPAQRWTERGREHGSRDEHDDAIACFVAAAEADPHDPDSRYLHAFTLMRMDRPELALPLYDEVERLAPGWFHARTWRSLAQRQLDGVLAHETTELINLLQDGELPAAKRLEFASRGIAKWPRVPELFLYRGEALAELDREPEPAWLAGLELAGELPAIRSRLLHALGRLDEVVEIEGGNLMAIAAARMQLRLGLHT